MFSPLLASVTACYEILAVYIHFLVCINLICQKYLQNTKTAKGFFPEWQIFAEFGHTGDPCKLGYILNIRRPNNFPQILNYLSLIVLSTVDVVV